MPQRILMTGFEPFADETINPSWEAVSRLAGVRVNEHAEIVAVRLPCVFGTALQELEAAVDRYAPCLVIAVGQAGGRSELALERVAINIDDARIPDNAGNQPIDEQVEAGGPAAYFSTLPVKAIVQVLQAAALPACVSQSAGTFVCNHVFYGLMRALHRRNGGVRGGFIHVPYLPEQAIRDGVSAHMNLEQIVNGLRLAAATSLLVAQDVRVSGGSVF